MSDKTTMEKRLSFTLKDLIYIVVILISVLSNYYSTDTRLQFVERKVIDIQSELKAYKGLPAKVANIEIQVSKNVKTTQAIYLGLIANGTIEPPSPN